MKNKKSKRVIKIISCILLLCMVLSISIFSAIAPAYADTQSEIKYYISLPLSELGKVGFQYPARRDNTLSFWKNLDVTLDSTINFENLGFSITAPLAMTKVRNVFAFGNESIGRGFLTDVKYEISKAKYDKLKASGSNKVVISVSIYFGDMSTVCYLYKGKNPKVYECSYTLTTDGTDAVESEENKMGGTEVTGEGSKWSLSEIFDLFKKLFDGKELSVMEYVQVVGFSVVVLILVLLVVRIFSMILK